MEKESEELFDFLREVYPTRSEAKSQAQNPPIIQLSLSFPEWLYAWNREKLQQWKEMLTSTKKVNRMKLSQKGRDLLKFLEGFRSTPYLCPGGVKTIGYGHTRTVRDGMKITKLMAEEFLSDDLSTVERAIARLVTVELTQNQFDALALFTFNVGIHAFEHSTLLKLLNKGWYSQVPTQLSKWVFAGGKKSNGLVNRRLAEIGLWNAPTRSEAKPKRSEGEP